MPTISLGPLIFAGDRLAAILGLSAFLLLATLLDRRFAPGLGRAAWWALLAGLLGARMGHVAQHWGSFSQDPARILSVWQGGFAHMPVLWALWPSAHGGQPRRLPPPPPSACCSGAASAN